ncbi:tannase and feruloyl esterase-domain-containing protein [Xylaria sp. CBS 124048]|nr:tannase and feruloyl esterase-domain-containing protein [Xylaria sp. CBS 124048]
MPGSVMLGKLLTEAYYMHSIAYSYYNGHPTGGRQGLEEMQTFPGNFNGVLVNAAVWYTSHANTWATQVATCNWPADDEKRVDPRLLPAIAAEGTKQCDGIDGAVDGIISLAELCNVNLSCESAGSSRPNCLTAAQARILASVYSDWKTAKGEFFYNGLSPEIMGGDMKATREFFRYFMFQECSDCGRTVDDAPWVIGGTSQASSFGNDTWSVPGFQDAQHDILLALVDWVEKNVSIDQVVATTWKIATNASSGVLRQRPLCPYPQMAIWDGDGDVNDAKSWGCG